MNRREVKKKKTSAFLGRRGMNSSQAPRRDLKDNDRQRLSMPISQNGTTHTELRFDRRRPSNAAARVRAGGQRPNRSTVFRSLSWAQLK